eukprot:1146809-Pelagomonas_calceolata.AAC.12
MVEGGKLNTQPQQALSRFSSMASYSGVICHSVQHSLKEEHIDSRCCSDADLGRVTQMICQYLKQGLKEDNI